ncbi:MAG TPA: hypothetical protein VI703_06925 [Anaerolineales bacterium]|nr:hypothetical protein [Anaerolineales bacterium]
MWLPLRILVFDHRETELLALRLRLACGRRHRLMRGILSSILVKKSWFEARAMEKNELLKVSGVTAPTESIGLTQPMPIMLLISFPTF